MSEQEETLMNIIRALDGLTDLYEKLDEEVRQLRAEVHGGFRVIEGDKK